MADANVPPNDDSPDDETAADDNSSTASNAWLNGLLWSSPPSTAHLKKFHARAQVDIPATLSEEFSSVERIQILGVPDGAEVVGAEQTEPGAWTLPDSSHETFAVLPAPESVAAEIDLTIKVDGRETPEGDIVSVLGGVRAHLPATRRAPLFAELPDMRAARERAERERQEAAEQEKQAREKAAEEARQNEKSEEIAAEKPATLSPSKPPGQTGSAKKKPPRRRAAVALKPVEKPKAETPPSPAASADKPKRRAAVTLKPVKAPTASPSTSPKKPSPPTAEAASEIAEKPKKPAVRWSKPVTRRTKAKSLPSKPEETETGTLVADQQNMIAIELGGAPEVGDPHFRLLVDGVQVLDGNIDWNLGMPASDSDSGDLCWQTREIPWNADDGDVDTIILRYDQGTGGTDTVGTLLAKGINVGGLRIDAEGPYAQFPDGRWPWAGRGDYQSWRGDLVFNVAGARRGDPDFGNGGRDDTDTELDTTAAGRSGDADFDGASSLANAISEKVLGPASERPPPLVLRPSADDLANPAVMAAFADLRQRLANDGESTDSVLGGMLSRLNFENANWSDLIVLDPSGEPVSIDSAPMANLPETAMSFPAEDIQEALVRLEEDDFSATLSTFTEVPAAPADAELQPVTEIVATGPAIRDRFFADLLDKAVSQRETTAEIDRSAPVTVGIEEGVAIRDAFLSAWTIRAKPQEVPAFGATTTTEPETNTATDEATGTSLGESFLASRLQVALGRLQTQATKPPAADSGDLPPEFTPSSPGAIISAGFLNEILDRATGQLNAGSSPAPA